MNKLPVLLSDPDVALAVDYTSRTGLHIDDFARRINYSPVTFRKFLVGSYLQVGKSDHLVRKAIRDYIELHPIEPLTTVAGDLYDTENVRRIEATFRKLLERPVAYMIYAPPGSQKTFAMENAIARLNREEQSKNGHGCRAYYVYARQNLRPRDLMRRVCAACGVPTTNDIDRMLGALRFQFQHRRTLLVVDEAQHLELECFEILRELLDCPPHMSLLFAGSHDLKQKFDRFSATLEQWNSRIVAKVRLPGLQEQEARGIIEREIGAILSQMPSDIAQAKANELISRSTTRDAFEKGRTYINVRTLTSTLAEIRAASAEKSEAVA